MERIFNELMSGGWTPDDDCDLASDRDIWEDQMRNELSQMSNEALSSKRLEVSLVEPFDAEFYELICIELQKRDIKPVSEVFGSKADPSCPSYCGPEEEGEDERKARLEALAPDEDELPF